MNRQLFSSAFVIGGIAILWVAYGFLGANHLALAMTLVVAAAYLAGALELQGYRRDTSAFRSAVAELKRTPDSLTEWLSTLPVSMQTPVRLRVEGMRVGMPGPTMAPFLVGLLVMLGMLGTFLGMVVTLSGAAFALEGTTDLQAVRAAFAVPIKGLGLSFGTSVAGVAASAMLGLMLSIVKRERMIEAQALDGKIAGVLHQFTDAYQREQTLDALKKQSEALPLVADQMQAAMLRMEALSQQLNDRLQLNQERFHIETKEVYTELARSVDQSLRTSMAQSANLAADTIKPVVVAAMAALADESVQQQTRTSSVLQSQLDTLATSLATTAGSVTDAWQRAVENQDRAGIALAGTLETTLSEFVQSFENRSIGLVHAVKESQAAANATQSNQDAERLAAWVQTLQTIAVTIRQDREQASAAAVAQQQQLSDTWLSAANAIANHAKESASQTVSALSRMGDVAQDMAHSRLELEATWADAQRERMEKVAEVLRSELTALREDEAMRGRAAVERLAELQADVGTHLATLGASLEAPIARLMVTASEAPRAAAEVIGQLRQEVSLSAARDNELLEERTRILATLNNLLAGINHASVEQRTVIDALVTSSATALESTSQNFAAKIDIEAAKLEGIAAHVTTSAVDVAALSDTLGFSMRSFNEANQKLITNLQSIEGALGKSLVRSDDQLAYYVAQAREIIDLSVMAQKEMVEAMQQLPAAPTRVADRVEG